MTKTVICVDSRPFAKFAFGQTRHHTKKGRTLRFAPTRHTERCLLTAYRTAFPPFEGVTSPLRFALNDKLMVNCQWLIVMRGYPNANFANGANQRK